MATYEIGGPDESPGCAALGVITDETSCVVGPAVGVVAAAKGPVTPIDTLVSQFGGSLPPFVDVHYALGANPAGSVLNPWASNDPNAHIVLFQKSVNQAGHTLLTQVGQSITMPYGTQFTDPGVALDPTLGDLVIFSAQSNDPISVGFTLPGAPAPKPGTPGGPVPLSPPGPADKVANAIADALAGAALFIVIIGMVMVYSNPTLPAKLVGGGYDEFKRHRTAPEEGA